MRKLNFKLKKLDFEKLRVLANVCLSRRNLGQSTIQQYDHYATEVFTLEYLFKNSIENKLGKIANSNLNTTTSLKLTEADSITLLNAILYYRATPDCNTSINAILLPIQLELEQFVHESFNNINNVDHGTHNKTI